VYVAIVYTCAYRPNITRKRVDYVDIMCI